MEAEVEEEEDDDDDEDEDEVEGDEEEVELLEYDWVGAPPRMILIEELTVWFLVRVGRGTFKSSLVIFSEG